MRTFYQILIILFIIFSFLIIKDDPNSILNSISSYLNKKEERVEIKTENKEALPLEAKINTPGPLEVLGDFLVNNNSKLIKDNIIKISNKYRELNGDLNNLKENNRLDLSAEKKLKDMFDNQYFEHISFEKIGVGELGDQVGYEYILIGENLALGNFKDDLALVDAWMASPGHKENILNKNYTEIGVAVGKGKFNGKNVWMAVQHFGTPREVCPIIDKILYGSIDINQRKIEEIEIELLLRKDKIDERELFEGNTLSEQIDYYNNLVNYHNNLLDKIKKEIEIYNKQIQSFNSCLSNYK